MATFYEATRRSTERSNAEEESVAVRRRDFASPLFAKGKNGPLFRNAKKREGKSFNCVSSWSDFCPKGKKRRSARNEIRQNLRF